MTHCEHGHTRHKRICVATDLGPMHVFDSFEYEDLGPGWCPGRHAVCDRLRVEGRWEAVDTAPIRKILENGSRNNLVIDFGAHAGWYTLMAAQLGYMVWAIEGDPDAAHLLRANIAMHRLQDRVTVFEDWVDTGYILPGVVGRDVELVKSDLEGAERYAVAACKPFLDRVHHMYLEISPVFADYYPDMVDDLLADGFTAYYPDNRLFNDDYSLTQINLRLSRGVE